MGFGPTILRGIRARLLGLVLITVLPSSILVGAGLWSNWHGDSAKAVQQGIFHARLLAARLDDHLGTLEALLLGVSRSVSADPAHADANDALLEGLKAELPNYISNILLFSLDGKNIGRSSRGGGGERGFAGDRDYFHLVLQGQQLAIGRPLLSRVNKQWVITVARPVKDAGGRLQAVLVVGTLLSHVQHVLRAHQLPEGSAFQIVDQNGTVVGHSSNMPDSIGHDVGATELFQLHRDKGEGAETIVWPDGLERITGWSPAGRIPWTVLVGRSPDVVLAGVLSRLKWEIAISAATLILALAVAAFFSGRLVRPLRRLTQDAAALEAGNLSHRTSVATNDEVGALARTLNRMAASMQSRHHELESARELAVRQAEDRAKLQELEREAKETLGAVIDASPVAIVCSDVNRHIVVWSRAAEEIFGYAAHEVIGQPTKLLPPDRVDESRELFSRAVQGETLRDVQVKRKRKDGSLVDVRVAAAPMRNIDGSVRGVAWAYEDITYRKRVEEQLERLAHYDQLTGLPNRLTLQKELGRLLSHADAPICVVVFDLDGFKYVNDTLGHSTGDQLLIEVGRRLVEAAAGRGRICRLGGDEFVAILPDCGDPRVAAELVGAMLNHLKQPFVVDDHTLHFGASAGIAIAPNDGANVDDLIANADLALYEAKKDGRGSYRFFISAMRARAQARHSLEADLRNAFEQRQFQIYYQPQIRIGDGAVTGAEALLRWRHPNGVTVAPAAFLETLAESEIAADVGKWILREACQRTMEWRREGFPLTRIGVNLFPAQLRSETFVKDVEGALADTKLPPEILELEITENVALTHDDAIAPIQKLQDIGVQFAFDDFGTGYASLTYLTRYPLSRIKIDRSFVADMANDEQKLAIVRSLIVMAHNLRLGVIAEGVESAAELRILRDIGCEEAQGYLFARPLPRVDFERFLGEAIFAGAPAGRTPLPARAQRPPIRRPHADRLRRTS